MRCLVCGVAHQWPMPCTAWNWAHDQNARIATVAASGLRQVESAAAPPVPDDTAVELAHLDYVLADLGSLKGSAGGQMNVAELEGRYRQRVLQLRARQEAAAAASPPPVIPTPWSPSSLVADLGTVSLQSPATAPRATMGSTAAPVVARPPRPSLAEVGRRFVSEHAILLMSYLGAFLLIIAALLFLLYGPSDLPGGVRLATVACVNAVLGAAAVVCLRHRTLRLVAASYTAIAALMVPVTLTAAYEFVVRDAIPLTGTTALSMGALACSVLYGLLAVVFSSRAYASLSLLAAAVCGVAGGVATGVGPSLLPIAALFTSGCWLLRWHGDQAFALPSVIAGHVSAWATIGAATGFATATASQGTPTLAAFLPLSLAAVAASYALRYALARDDLVAILAAALFGAAIMTATQTLGFGAAGAATSLVGLGLIAAGASTLRARPARMLGRSFSAHQTSFGIACAAAALLTAVGLVMIPVSGLQLVLFPMIAVGGFVIAFRRTVWWLTVGVAALALQAAVEVNAQALLPDTPAYIPTTLATIFLVFSAAARIRRDRALATPAALALVAAVLAIGGAQAWTPDALATSLVAIALVESAIARRLGVRVSDLAHPDTGVTGLDNSVGWVAALAAAGSGLFPISYPAVQFLVLGAAIGCGLVLALRLQDSAWLGVGLVALVAQVSVDANMIALAGRVPAYVPAALGAFVAACAVAARVHRDRRLVIPIELALIAGALTAGSRLGWPADGYAGALAGLAGFFALLAYVVPVRVPLADGADPVWRTFNNVGAWFSALTALAASCVLTSGPALPYVVLAVAVGVGLMLAIVCGSPWWLLTGAVALFVDAAVHGSSIAAAGVLPAYVPAVLMAILLSIATLAVLRRDRTLVIPANLCLTAVALTANSAAGLGVEGYALELVVLAYLGTLTALVSGRPQVSMLLRLGAGARLCFAALVLLGHPSTETFILAAGVACAAWLAYSSGRPEWLYLAGVFLAGGWYAGATAIGAASDIRSLTAAVSPLPFIYLASGGLLAAIATPARRKAWATPPVLLAVVGGVCVAALAIGDQAWTVLASSLFAESAIVYVVARHLRRVELVYIAASLLAGATLALLAAVDGSLVAYPLALAAGAWAIRLIGGVESSREESPAWVAAHRRASLAVAGLAVCAPLVNAAFAAQRESATIAELVTSISLALVVWMGVSVESRLRDRYVAVVLLALALEWLPVFFGVREAQAYIILPSAALIVCGVGASVDLRLGVRRIVGDALVLVGCTAALMTTLAEVLATGVGSWYTAWLLVEGLVIVGAAIVVRSRVLSVAGGAAIAAAAACALAQVVSSVPLYAVFGGAAVLLLVVATVLATQRHRIRDTRESLRDTWRSWGSSASVPTRPPTGGAEPGEPGQEYPIRSAVAPPDPPPPGQRAIFGPSARPAVDRAALLGLTSFVVVGGVVLASVNTSPIRSWLKVVSGQPAAQIPPSQPAAPSQLPASASAPQATQPAPASPTQTPQSASPAPTGPVVSAAWTTIPIGAANLSAVSCPSTDFCVAVDRAGDVITSTNPLGGASAWNVTSVDSGVNAGLTGVSCPSAALCIAVDSTGHVVTSIHPMGGPSAWTVTRLDQAGNLNGVSCASVAFCVAVDTNGDAVTTTDPLGGPSAWTVSNVDGSNSVSAVSCPSTHLCVAVDSNGDVMTSSNPARGASTWTRDEMAGLGALDAVACPSVLLCVATAESGDVIISTARAAGISWRTVSAESQALYGVSCPTVRLCVAVDAGGDAAVSTNPSGASGSWTTIVVDAKGFALSGVSCPTARLCVAVDTQNDVVVSTSPATTAREP
jgi:hypothetical protein